MPVYYEPIHKRYFKKADESLFYETAYRLGFSKRAAGRAVSLIANAPYGSVFYSFPDIDWYEAYTTKGVGDKVFRILREVAEEL